MMSNELRLFQVPEKLNKITISGLNLLSISDGAFKVHIKDFCVDFEEFYAAFTFTDFIRVSEAVMFN